GPGAADARADLGRRPDAIRADGRLPFALFHLRRDQLRGRRPAGEARGDRRALFRWRAEPPRRHLHRLPGLAFQRPSLEHGAASPTDARVARVRGGHGSQTRRTAHSDPIMTETPQEALEQAALAGIHRLSIPTPFAVGRVNCYLIEDEPLTLVDTGPNSGKSLDELQRQLGERDHSIDELDLVILTHQHIDHLALVEIVVEHSGADVAAIGLAAQRLATFDEDAEREDEFAVDLMLRNGIPPEVAHALQSVSRSFRGWGSHATVTRPLDDGEVIEFRDR